MNKLFIFRVFVFSSLLSNPVYGQIEKGTFINASAGLGLCAPYDETDASGTGFYAQAEYVLNFTGWLGLRPYAGIIMASGESGEQDLQDWKIKSNAAVIGAKIRIAAPIPYVAPFIESGMGVSAGSFETHTPATSIKKNGVLFHIPLTLGLVIGRRHNYEIKFTYYYHEAAEQFSGAAALGLSFPLAND